MVSRQRLLIILLIIMCFFSVLATSLGIMAQGKTNRYRAFAGGIKAAVAGSPLASDSIPDQIRYDYEDLFDAKW